MSLIPPTELQEIMAQGAVGLSADDCDRIAALVEAGYENWRNFHDQFHAERKMHVPDPGQATLGRPGEVCNSTMSKASECLGFLLSDLNVGTRNKSNLCLRKSLFWNYLTEPTFVVPMLVEGQLSSPKGITVRPGGLNVPLIADALRAAAFPTEPTGIAHLRWSETEEQAVSLPKETVGLIGVVRVAVRREASSGWVDHKNELHLWFVRKQENPPKLSVTDSGRRSAQHRSRKRANQG